MQLQPTEKKKKKVPLDTMKVPVSMIREVAVEAANQDKFIYEVVADAWVMYGHLKGLDDLDRPLLFEIAEMIQDANGSYRASVADMVQAWREGRRHGQKLATSPAKSSRQGKARTGS